MTDEDLRLVADNAPPSVRGALRALAQEVGERPPEKDGTRAFLEKCPPRFPGR